MKEQRRRQPAWLFAALLLVMAGGTGLGQDITATVGARVKEAASRLTDAFAGGPVRGRFLERLPGSYVFAPEDKALPVVAVTNPYRIGTLAVGPLVVVRGELDAAARTLELENYALAGQERAPQPVERSDPAGSPLAQAFTAANAIMGRLDAAAKPGALSVESRALNRESDLGRAILDNIADFARAYRAAVDAGDPTTVDRIVARWSEVRAMVVETLPDGTEYKAVYGAPDYYPPWRYDRIFRDSAAVVAIGEPGKNTARCSGVLIGEDLVLTAGHCFAGPPPKEPGELEVWFDYVELADGSRHAPVRRKILAEPVAPPSAKWPDLMQRRFEASLYDYAIVRFQAPAGQPLVPNEARPQCLRNTPLSRADALYVVGYPRGNPATVHDNGRVELPYRVLSGDDFDLLRLEVDADFKDKPERTEVLREFDQSYVLDDAGVLKWYYFFDIRDGGQPRMGIVADTFRGNSGGPVYDHERDQCVVGILNRGMEDTGSRLEANWKVHERVLPIRAILDDLRRRPETTPLVEEGKLRIVD